MVKLHFMKINVRLMACKLQIVCEHFPHKFKLTAQKGGKNIWANISCKPVSGFISGERGLC